MRFRTVLLVGVLLLTKPAYGWKGEEHAMIGSTAYAAACEAIEQSLASSSGNTAQVRRRLAVACFKVPATPGVGDSHALQALFGDWSAIAADHADKPKQLTDLKLQDVIVDYRKFTLLVITNYKHFHPAVVKSWREDHVKALQAAVEASTAQDLDLQNAYESALAVEAFAQHYLQDSFSSGHMGFNRVASSNAATVAYHDRASRVGRCVANLNGETWRARGDNYLDENGDHYFNSKDANWIHVAGTASASLVQFITAFVFGTFSVGDIENIEVLLPAFVKETRSQTEPGCHDSRRFVSLRSLSLPATTAMTMDLWFVRDATAYYSKPTMQGYMLGGSVEFAPIPIGYRRIQNRVQLGIGRTYSEIGPHAWLFDVQYLWHVGTSNRGILTHEIGIGEGDYWANTVHYEQLHLRAIYNVNVEVGRTYMRIQVALARSSFRWGPYVSIGVGTVIRAGQ